MRSKMSELVKKMGKVGTEMNHGDWDVMCPRMLVRKMQRAAVNGGRSPLWLSSSGWRSGRIETVPGRPWGECQVLN